MKRFDVTTVLAFLLASLFCVGEVLASTWDVDQQHSNIYFTVDHIYAKVRGRFTDFNAKVVFDPADLQHSQLLFTIKVASIDTGISKRDKHLLSAEFFDAAKYPVIVYESKALKDMGNGVYEVSGKLTVKGKTYDLSLPLKYGVMKDHPAMPGKQVMGLTGQVTVDRIALNIGDEKYYKMGMVGKDVDVLVTLEALRDKQ